jgi:cysteine desulfurase/selenocysteine lyase
VSSPRFGPADFPILSRRLDGRRLVYLDSAATAQKPRQVLDAMRAFYEHSNSNAHRGVYRLGEEASAELESAREAVRRFIGASSSDEVIFTHGTTESLNLVASGWAGPRLRPGDEIAVTELEHHSNYLPWQRIARATGATLRLLPVDADGRLEPYELGPRTRVLAVAHISNVLGVSLPVRELVQAARAVGAAVVVDAAQSVPHERISVQELDCDFLAFSGHKMLGPSGIGVLWGRRERLEETEPLLLGGGMVRDSLAGTWLPLPHKLEAGTQPLADAVGLRAAIEYLEALGMDAVRSHARELSAAAVRALSQVKGVSVHAAGAERESVVSFELEKVHPHDLASFLDTRAICVRAGHHCAQPLMRRLGVLGTVRASVQVYSTAEDIELLAQAVDEARTAI